MIGKPAECKTHIAEAIKLRPELEKNLEPLLTFAEQP
jgi:hypothetical protein